MNFFATYRWAIAGAAILAALGALAAVISHFEQVGYDRARAEDQVIINKQKLEAATLLQSKTAEVLAAQAVLDQFRTQQEIQDESHQQTVSSLSKQLRDLGRLRDPQASGCGSSGGSAQGGVAAGPVDSAANAAEGAGLLSGPLTELLQSITAEADAINTAYISCRAYALEIVKSSK
jgi:hypothetical protein